MHPIGRVERVLVAAHAAKGDATRSLGVIEAWLRERGLEVQTEPDLWEYAARREQAVIRVLDRGPGIPEEHREKIFHRFFSYRDQAHPSRAQEGHTGLGLAIVKAIVEGYGGTITAENRPSGGAVFEIRLPAVS